MANADTTAERESAAADDQRSVMVDYLREVHQEITRLLDDADFDDEFPYVFGHPDTENAELTFHANLALLLRKAQMHITVVIHANRNENLHSMAVHIRVILECAAWIAMQVHPTHEGSPRALDRVLNADEYDFQDAILRLLRGSMSRDELHESIINARRGVGDDRAEPPRPVRIADRLQYLRGGKEMYDFISTHFAGNRVDSLPGPSAFGGVLSVGTDADRLPIALFLDYLAEQCALMLLNYGFVLIAITGDSGPFDGASALVDRLRADAGRFRSSIREHSAANP